MNVKKNPDEDQDVSINRKAEGKLFMVLRRCSSFRLSCSSSSCRSAEALMALMQHLDLDLQPWTLSRERGSLAEHRPLMVI